MKKVLSIVTSFFFIVGVFLSVHVVASQSTLTFEKLWESSALADYPYDMWGLEVYDIDGDGALEILASTMGNNISVFSCADFSLEKNILASSTTTFSYIYAEVDVGQVDSDPSIEIVCCRTGGLLGGFSVIDATSGMIEWEYSTVGIDSIALCDIDSDGKDEIIVGSNAIEIYDADAQTILGKTKNITGLIEDIEIGNVVPGGNLEIVVAVNEFYGNGRLLMFDAVTYAEILNKSISSELKCVDFGDVDSDGSNELILGDGYIGTSLLEYHGYLRILNTDGQEEWKSSDLEEIVEGVELEDVDGDGTLEIIMTTDKINVLSGSDKSTLWTSDMLISVGEEDALVIKDINGDGKKDIVTRASSYSENNRLLVYGQVPIIDDGDGDVDGEDGQIGAIGSFLEDYWLIISVIVVVAVVAIAGVSIYFKRAKKS